MYSHYKIIDVLAKKAGGPYTLSTIIVKRARQILKGEAHLLGLKKSDSLQEALEDFAQDKLAIGISEDVAPEAEKGDEPLD